MNTYGNNTTLLSKQAAVAEVVLDNDVRDCRKHKLDVLCVRGAREVRVDGLLLGVAVQALKLPRMYSAASSNVLGPRRREEEERRGRRVSVVLEGH